MKPLIAYVPAIHRGYIELFRKYEKGTLYVLSDAFRGRFTSLERDVRAVSASEAAAMVRSLGIFRRVIILSPSLLESVLRESKKIAAPDESVMHDLLDHNVLQGITEVSWESWFLRWDKTPSFVPQEINPDEIIPDIELHRRLLGESLRERVRSSDFWRQVGVVVARSGEILFRAYNRHIPNDRTPYIDGDPRSNFNAGESIECSTALHGEIGAICKAARKGIAIDGASLYVTTFPCPNCAWAIMESGFSEIYYRDGYSNLGAVEKLKQAEIRIIRVTA